MNPSTDARSVKISSQVLLVPSGSEGDVLPFIGMGRELKRRGIDVTMIANAYFEPVARGAGIDFAACARREEYLDIIGSPDIWHPSKAAPLLATKSVIPAIETVYRMIEERYRPGRTVAVAGSLALGARVAQESLGIPLTTIHLQPAVFRSRYQPPLYPGMTWVHWVPRALLPAVFRLMDHMVDSLYAEPLNAFRGQLGLRPISGVMGGWWHSPEQTLGLFPSWFAPPQPDWPSMVSVVDFPLFELEAPGANSPELDAYLNAGEPPLVFTLGSAIKTGRDFFAISARACERLGRRGVFLTPHAEQLPRPLPSAIRHFDRAPFNRLLSRSAVFVHHGGIGSVAQGLKAGVPQLVMPSSFDQLDNAARLQRIGVGLTVPRSRYRLAAVVKSLRRLLDDPHTRARCAQRAECLAGGGSIETIVDRIDARWKLQPDVAYVA